MRRGAKEFGERGFLGERERPLEFDRCLFKSLDSLISLSISALSSRVGPSIHATKDSPYICCLHLPPGALKDLSCRGGRPGIVANQC